MRFLIMLVGVFILSTYLIIIKGLFYTFEKKYFLAIIKVLTLKGCNFLCQLASKKEFG